MIFVDEHERVYQSFQHYRRSNQLPSSFVIAPSRGVFNTDPKGIMAALVTHTCSVPLASNLDCREGSADHLSIAQQLVVVQICEAIGQNHQRIGIHRLSHHDPMPHGIGLHSPPDPHRLRHPGSGRNWRRLCHLFRGPVVGADQGSIQARQIDKSAQP